MSKTTLPTKPVIEPGILKKSGLDITLENIEIRLTNIDKKLDDAPSREKVQDLEDKLIAAQDANRALEKKHDEEVAALADQYASKSRFELVEKLVFGAVAIVLIAVATAALQILTKGA